MMRGATLSLYDLIGYSWFNKAWKSLVAAAVLTDALLNVANLFYIKIEMMKTKITVICSSVFIFLFISLNTYSQNCEILNRYGDSIYTKKEIQMFEKQICKMLKKQKAVPEDTGINIYYIPDCYVPDYYIMPLDSIGAYFLLGKIGVRVDKKDFLAGTFLKRLSVKDCYTKRGKNYISAKVIISNSSDSLIAVGDIHYLHIVKRYVKGSFSFEPLILKKIHELKLRYLFTLHNLWSRPIFGVTGNDEIIVFLNEEEERVYTIKEFVDTYSKKSDGKIFSD